MAKKSRRSTKKKSTGKPIASTVTESTSTQDTAEQVDSLNDVLSSVLISSADSSAPQPAASEPAEVARCTIAPSEQGAAETQQERSDGQENEGAPVVSQPTAKAPKSFTFENLVEAGIADSNSPEAHFCADFSSVTDEGSKKSRGRRTSGRARDGVSEQSHHQPAPTEGDRPAEQSTVEHPPMEVDTTSNAEAQQQSEPVYSVIREKTKRTPFVKPKTGRSTATQGPGQADSGVVDSRNTSAPQAQSTPFLVQPSSDAPVELTFDPRTHTIAQYKEILRNVATAMRHAYDEHCREVEQLRLRVLATVVDARSGLLPCPNHAAQDVCPLPPVAPNSSFLINFNTVEELTAIQLRAVHNFITRPTTGGSEPALIPNYQGYPPGCSRARLLVIINSYNSLNTTIDRYAIELMGQLAVVLHDTDPWKHCFVALMAWINELTHCLTAINVHRDIIQEEILPYLISMAYEIERFPRLLSRHNITPLYLHTLLTRSSAVSAHLTRFIRSLEALQLSQLATLGEGDPAARNLLSEFQAAPPGEFAAQSVTEYLKWWREHFSEQFRSRATTAFMQNVSAHVERSLGEVHPQESTAHAALTTLEAELQKPKFKSGGFGPKQPSPVVLREGERPQQPQPQAVARRQSPTPAPPPATASSQSREAGPQGSSIQARGRSQDRKRSHGQSRDWRDDSRRARFEETQSSQSCSSTSYGGSPAQTLRRRGLPPVPPQKVPLPGQPPCVFCSSKGHYSAECDVYRHLTMRANLLVSQRHCTICLRNHFGDCIRADGCGICRERSHHQALCVNNPFVVNDIAMMAQRFYRNIADASYQDIPPNQEQRQPHQERRPRARTGRSRHRHPGSGSTYPSDRESSVSKGRR